MARAPTFFRPPANFKGRSFSPSFPLLFPLAPCAPHALTLGQPTPRTWSNDTLGSTASGVISALGAPPLSDFASRPGRSPCSTARQRACAHAHGCGCRDGRRAAVGAVTVDAQLWVL
eukprot:360122-Chlamydomonas_euryale.AAC.1